MPPAGGELSKPWVAARPTVTLNTTDQRPQAGVRAPGVLGVPHTSVGSCQRRSTEPGAIGSR
jgi:hypothetical protein